MSSNKIKKLVKQYVKESLTEIFAEMHLESIIKEVVNSQTDSRPSLQEVMQPARAESYTPTQVSSFDPRQKAELLGVSEQEWRDIYGDIPSSNNSIFDEADGHSGGVEVPENVLVSMGLMKDYSKHIPSSTTSRSQPGDDTDWEALQEERRKMLNSKIVKG